MGIKGKLLLFLRENILKFDLPFMEERRNFFTFKQKKMFIDYLNKKFPELEISVLEIGAKEGLCYNYQILKYLNNFYLEGIEPQKDEALKLLNEKKYPYKKVYNEAVSSKNGEQILYITKSNGCSSLYKPNFFELRKYNEENDFEVIREEKIIVKRLDSLIKRHFDFINLDIQGSEYDALIGGSNLIKNSIGMSFECHLFQLYQNQKLFSDIHLLIKNQFKILRFKTRTYKGLLFEISDVSAIKDIEFIKTKVDLIKSILYCVLWERKEYISTLLRNKGILLDQTEQKEIRKILKIYQ
jgi:FkbM family methyltransferase